MSCARHLPGCVFAIQFSRSDEDREAAAAQMDRETERLSELVGALLQVTREEGDPSSHRSDPLLMAPLIEEILEGCEYEAKYHGCGIRSCLDPSAMVYGDPEMLRRAIENIVENAIRYAPKHSDVGVALSIDRGAVSVVVRDYGPGVPPQDLERIFTPFYRVDPSRDATTGGIGLGLAIARRAAALNRGTLRADNANPGRACP
jgi:signal transduction histidine kinase